MRSAWRCSTPPRIVDVGVGTASATASLCSASIASSSARNFTVDRHRAQGTLDVM